MQFYNTCIVSSLLGLTIAMPQGDQVSCRNPVVTVTSVVDQTITMYTTSTVGPTASTITLPATVTSIVVENANPCSANNAKNKRDALGGIQPFRNPRLPPQPPYAPDCSGAPTTTTTQTTTMMRYEQSTVTTSLTATPPVSTAYKTTYVTSTTTQSSSPSKSCPTIAATVQQSGYTTDYVLYISTCGRTLSYNNPANTNPPVVLAIRAKVLACEAARQCADAARNQGAGYLSFDLHWKFESGWQCVMFYGRNRDGKYWEVTKGVGEGYGYSL